ncbi:MAG: hypothetical protein ACRCYT_00290 [Cetobacterium sp.]
MKKIAILLSFLLLLMGCASIQQPKEIKNPQKAISTNRDDFYENSLHYTDKFIILLPHNISKDKIIENNLEFVAIQFSKFIDMKSETYNVNLFAYELTLPLSTLEIKVNGKIHTLNLRMVTSLDKKVTGYTFNDIDKKLLKQMSENDFWIRANTDKNYFDANTVDNYLKEDVPYIKEVIKLLIEKE